MTNRYKEELGKFCWDISKLSIGSWIFGLFSAKLELPQIIFGIAGLTFAILFFILGMRLLKETL